ncbi:MAG: hypothetical protein NTY07_00140 [Bacteroidia bacterium]|nr:hypothetical protein [Bacteroidia bacterium]
MGTIYCWFESLFGQDLAEHLWGWDMGTQDYTKANQFNTIGLYMLVVSIFMVVFFYYILNHPRFNRWWSWSLILGLNAGLNFLYAWLITLSDLSNNFISDDLVYIRDVNTNQIVTQKLSESNCVYFGIANTLIACLFFIIFSFTVRWWSKNCSTCPYPN